MSARLPLLQSEMARKEARYRRLDCSLMQAKSGQLDYDDIHYAPTCVREEKIHDKSCVRTPGAIQHCSSLQSQHRLNAPEANQAVPIMASEERNCMV